MIIKGEDLFKLCNVSLNNKLCVARDVDGSPYMNIHAIRSLNIPDELIDKYVAERDKKYHLHVLPGQDGYLQFSYDDEDYILDDFSLPDVYQQEFTQSEIDELCEKFPYIGFWSCAEEVK